MIFNQIVKGGSTPPSPVIEEKDVNFWDYDGTLVASYTKSEIASLSNLPNTPDHSEDEVPLTFEYWNWDLVDIKDFVGKYGFLDVGAIYKPTDNKTHILIHLDTINHISFGCASGITISWGDGNEEVTSTTNASHTYSELGDYHITLSDGSSFSVYNGIDSNDPERYSILHVYCNYGITTFPNLTYAVNLKTLSLPSGITMNVATQSLGQTYNLKCLNVPKGLNIYKTQNLCYCSGLEIICLPKYSASNQVGNNFVYYCLNLKRLSLQNIRDSGTTLSYSTVKKIQCIPSTSSNNICANCYNLQTVVMMNSSYSYKYIKFSLCDNILCIDCRNMTSVPTLPTTSGVPSNLYYIVIVPDNLYNDWITSTNWNDANIVSHIKKASEVTLS